MVKRFRDNSRRLFQFRDEIFVQCPACESMAIVKASGIKYDNTRLPEEAIQVKCTNCAFSKDSDSGYWVGPVNAYIHKPCQRCGQWIEKRLRRKRSGGDLPKVTTGICHGCKFANIEKVNWTRMDSGENGRDPYFGLPLWLQIGVKDEVLWLYNMAHLAEIERFVSADLRERNIYPISTMITKLPKWLKIAKNRPAILRGISELKRTLPGRPIA